MFQNDKGYSSAKLRKKEGESDDDAFKRLQDEGWSINDKNARVKENVISFNNPNVLYKQKVRTDVSGELPDAVKYESKVDKNFKTPTILNAPDNVEIEKIKDIAESEIKKSEPKTEEEKVD